MIPENAAWQVVLCLEHNPLWRISCSTKMPCYQMRIIFGEVRAKTEMDEAAWLACLIVDTNDSPLTFGLSRKIGWFERMDL